MMIGYKAFNADMTCRDFQYKVGKSYEMDGNIELCNRGYHFCENIADCFSYYNDTDTRFAKIEAYGEVIKSDDDSKCVTNKIRIIEEISRDDAVRMSNSGHCNSGNCNSGHCNSGDCNSGDWNSGDWNRSSYNNGCFMTVKPVIMLFNKPTKWTIEDWWNSYAREIMSSCPMEYTDTEWVCSSDMTVKEKELHQEHTTTDGYLKNVKHEADRQKWWDDLSDRRKQIVMSLPNFDADIFFECTGIRVEAEGEA